MESIFITHIGSEFVKSKPVVKKNLALPVTFCILVLQNTSHGTFNGLTKNMKQQHDSESLEPVLHWIFSSHTRQFSVFLSIRSEPVCKLDCGGLSNRFLAIKIREEKKKTPQCTLTIVHYCWKIKNNLLNIYLLNHLPSSPL